MGIIKAYNKGDMDKYRTISYKETGTQDPYIQKKEGFQYNAITSRTTDLQRFTKLVTSKPGLKFQGNQALLQQTDTLKSLKGGNVGRKLLQKAVKTATNNVASTLSILAQVPVNGTGTHFIKGLTPSGYLQNGNTRDTAFGQFLEDQGIGGGVNGAKSALAGEPIGSALGGPLTANVQLEDKYKSGEVSPTLSHPSLLTIETANQDSTVYPSDFENEEDYFDELDLRKSIAATTTKALGAPVFPYLGNTAREKYTNKESYPNLPQPINTSVKRTSKTNYYEEGDESGLRNSTKSTVGIDQKSADSLSEANTVRKDYNQEARNSFKSEYKLQDGENYITSPLNIKTRTKDYSSNTSLPQDQRYDYINRLAEQTESLLGTENQDIIPFEFNIFAPGQQEKFLYFRAFLGTLNDNYSGNWNGTQYIGRAEQFYTYQGFSRDISFDFKIAAFSKQELNPLYKKLNLLLGTTAPTYTQQGEFMKGTLISLTIGDYIYKQDGFISSINLSWNNTYPWEIDLYDEDLPKVPHMLDVNITFTPIHNFNVKSNVNSTDKENYVGGQKQLNAI